jgi:ATP-dependent Clp protease ATP-binding subunit ClpA
MWQRFNGEARQAIQHAQRGATAAGAPALATAHLLLGILHEENVATRVLRALDVEPELVRLAVQTKTKSTATGQESVPQYAKAAKRTLEFASNEAALLLDGFIGAEHLLLGLRRLPPFEKHFGFTLHQFYHKTGVMHLETLESKKLELQSRGEIFVPQLLDEFGLELQTLRSTLKQVRSPRDETDGLTEQTRRIVEGAAREARASGCGRIAPAHLWLAL